MSRSRTAYGVRRIALAVFSGALLVLAFPNFDIEWLAWVALVPLFFAIDGLSPRRAFSFGYLAGLVFFLGTISWLVHVTLPGTIIVCLYLALYIAFFSLVASLFLRSTNDDVRSTNAFRVLILCPATWTVLEFIRAHLLTGFGWALLGHSQSYTLPIIQIADLTGAYGVSFLVVLVNAAIFLVVRGIRTGRRELGVIAVALFLVFMSIAYGIIRLKNVFTGERVRVAVIQGNIPQEQKWDPAFKDMILDRYDRLTRASLAGDPDFIVWPEASVPGFLEGEKDLLRRVSALVRHADVPVLVGTVREGEEGEAYNGAVLFAPDGKIVQAYNKVHLVPFGEYIPFKKALSFIDTYAPVPIGDCTAGTEHTVFSFFMRRSTAGDNLAWRMLKKVKFGCLVCFEDIFPALARAFVTRGADFLVNITNDAWYKRSAAPWQHAQNSVFRAVENRTNVVRAANAGLSCFIDQHGRIGGVIGSEGDIFVDGFRVHEITVGRTRPFYTRYGDVFVYACLALVLFGLVTKKE